MKMKTEIGAMHLQAKECQELLKPPKLGEEHGTDSPSEPPKVINTANTLILDFWLPEL